jgi:hypothetical protein
MKNSSPKSKIKVKLIASFLLVSFLISYTIVEARQRHQLKVDSQKLNLVISETLDWVTTISVNVGKKIVAHKNYDDLQFIRTVLKDVVANHGFSERIVSWSMISWGNKNHKLVVNAVEGVKSNPDDLISRRYTSRSSYTPWSLQINKTDHGLLSDTIVIPAVVGVADDRDQFQGLVISGINAKKLLSKAEESIDSKSAFLVINRDVFYTDQEKVVLASSNTPDLESNHKKISYLVDKLKDWISLEEKSPVAINVGVYKYNYYRLMDGYQLAIVMGFNRLEFWGRVFSLGGQLFIGFLATVFLISELRKNKKS